jgi:hypothetical protein
LASLIDSVPLLVVFVPVLLARRRRNDLEPLHWGWSVATFAAEGVSTTLMLATGRQSLGQRVMSIRVVDAASGSPLGWHRAALRWAITKVPSYLNNRPVFGGSRASRREGQELLTQIEELKRGYGDDLVGLNEAMLRLYRENYVDVNPLAGCREPLIRGACEAAFLGIIYRPARRGPLHQGLHDRLVNAVVLDVR